MEGQVFVPYTGIGGFNMDYGFSTLSLEGSTAPGIVEGGGGTTYNLTWTFPGGINNQAPGGLPWGYALNAGEPCTQEDMEAWLRKDKTSSRYNPENSYAQTVIDAATDPQMAADINALMHEYLIYVMDIGDITRFRDNYPRCILRG